MSCGTRDLRRDLVFATDHVSSVEQEEKRRRKPVGETAYDLVHYSRLYTHSSDAHYLLLICRIADTSHHCISDLTSLYLHISSHTDIGLHIN